MYVSRPTYGSVMILKARAENGASSVGSRTISSPSSVSPCIGGTSSGDGR
jgi:hypothetical protein